VESAVSDMQVADYWLFRVEALNRELRVASRGELLHPCDTGDGNAVDP
jgi:hypothetical protein